MKEIDIKRIDRWIEKDWLESINPREMLECLQRRSNRVIIIDGNAHNCLYSNRKLNLYACACCLKNGTLLSMINSYERNGIGGLVNDKIDLIDSIDWARAWTKTTSWDKVPMDYRTNLLRDIFGNPFKNLSYCRCDPDVGISTCEWCDLVKGTPYKIAHRVYEERDWGAMPVLADALEEAGLNENEDKDILNHCRSNSVHTRGCWVIDLILGKQ